MVIKQQELIEFLKAIYKRYGYDFIRYGHTSLKRRIEVHCIKLNINNF